MSRKSIHLKDFIEDDSPKVEHTTDYEFFKLRGDNRLVDTRHVNRLIASITANDLTMYNPIMVDSSGYVIDGQHRLAALRTLRKPVYYIVMPEADANDIVTVNKVNKNWSPADYLDSFVSRGYEEYIAFKKAQDLNEGFFTITTLLYWFSSGKERDLKAFKDGKYKFDPSDEIKYALAKTKRLVAIAENYDGFPRNLLNNSAFHAACKEFFTCKGILMERFFNKLSDLRRPFPPINTKRQALQFLADIYNNKTRGPRISIIDTSKNCILKYNMKNTI